MVTWRRCLNIIYMYIAPELGQTTPCCQVFFINTNFLSICPFPASFLPLNNIFLFKCIGDLSWPCHKIGQGQPMVIIFANYDGLESPMLHTKFCWNQSASAGEEDFGRVFTIYGRGGHLGHVTKIPRTNLCSTYPRSLHIKFHFNRPSGIRQDVWILQSYTCI